MKDLRYYLRLLEGNAPEEIFRIRKEVDPYLEVTYIAKKLESVGRSPAIYCEKVKGFTMPVVTHLCASRKGQALALETDEANLEKEIWRRLACPIEPVIVASGPVKEVIHLKGDVDVGKLPILTVAEKDAAPYVTGGIMVVKDPETGVRNSGIYRIMYKGEKSRLGIFFLGDSQHAKHFYYKMEKADKPLEVAVYIGHHPATWIGSYGWGALGEDEMKTAGGLLKEPLELVKCETVDLEVPAHAEIVIEGLVPPHVREPEGPFNEYHMYYGPERLSPVLEITAITHRKDAIYFNGRLPSGLSPAFGLGNYRYVKRIKEVVPQVIDVRRINAGIAVVKVSAEFDGLSKQAGLAALGADYRPLIVIVVDEDIDIRDTEQVLWAVGTRTKPDRDFCFIYDVYGNVLEASGYSVLSRTEKNGLNTKVLIDATKPVGLPFPEKVDIARDRWEGIDLESLVRKD